MIGKDDRNEGSVQQAQGQTPKNQNVSHYDIPENVPAEYDADINDDDQLLLDEQEVEVKEIPLELEEDHTPMK